MFKNLIKKIKEDLYFKIPLYQLDKIFKLKRDFFYITTKECQSFFPALKQLKTNNIRNEFIKSLKNKNILFAIHSPEVSGAELYALFLMKKMNKISNLYCLATENYVYKDNSNIFKKHIKKFVNLINLSYEDKKNFIINFIEKNKIDIIHIHHSSVLYSLLPLIKIMFPKIKVIDTLHIIEYGTGGFPEISANFDNYIDKHEIISKNLLIFMIKRINQLKRNLNLNKFQLNYLTNNLKENYRNLNYSNLNNDLIKFKKKNKVKFLTFIGRFVHQKQINIFLDIIKKIKDKNKPYKFYGLLIGSGPLEKRIEKYIKKYLKNKIIYFKHIYENIEYFYKASDFFLITSLNEGIPVTIYELINSNPKCLIISTNVGGISEIIPQSLLIDETDINISEKFIEKIIFLENHPTEKEKLIKEINHRINLIKKFNMTNNNTNIINLYKFI